MKKKTIDEVIDSLYLKYKCIDEEDFYVEKTESYICLNWFTFMDSYISLARVKQVATYLRKYTNMPIYDALCNEY